MRLLIVDDEPAARERLVTLLAALDVEVVGEASDGVAALSMVQSHKPDVVLLDIAMPEADGFEVARHLPEPRPLVIFQTAYSDRALEAFEHEAVDFVVKPVNRERLAQAIDRARRRIESRASSDMSPALLERIEAALAQSRPVRRTRILVRHGTGHRALPLRDVVRFTAEEGLVFAVATSGKALTDYTLNELESRLGTGFIRVSRADLVQIDRIERLQSNGDGSATLALSDGATVHVSRRRAADVKQALS
jgi:two-component system response regulator AlgR